MNIHEETLKIARNLIEKDPSLTDWVISKFPELQESEDERIRKWIIDDIRYNINNEPLNNSEYKKKAEKAINWLEKQCKNNMGISEATKKKLEGNINKALEKETTESCNEFLENQGEQNLMNIDLDELVIQLEETIGTSPHSRETIKNFFQKAVKKYMNCLKIASGEIESLIEENYRLKENQSKQKTVDEIVKEACKDKVSAVVFLKSAGIMNEKGELAEQYRQDEQKPETIFLKFRKGDKVTNGKDIYTIDYIDKNCYCVKEHDCITIPFEYQHHWELVEQNPTDKVEPKFKVKYAGNEYNVIDVKDAAGITYYGIEDEPNHIDYVLPDNCEIVSEQNTIDKVKSKFHEGDWIISNNAGNPPLHITNINDKHYIFSERDSRIKIEDCDKSYHLWSLKDAKDGDVLTFDNNTIVIFKDLYNKTTFHSYCHIEDGVFSVSKKYVPDWWEGEGFKPATKEQCNILMKAMTAAGYTFDFEKKELKKINEEFNEED